MNERKNWMRLFGNYPNNVAKSKRMKEKLKKEILNLGYIDMSDDMASLIANCIVKFLKKLTFIEYMELLKEDHVE